MLAMVESHLRDTIQFSICTLMDVLPGEAAQDLHQDDAMYRLPWPHLPLTVNTAITLDEFTATNGATHIVPYSKDWGDAVDQERGAAAAVPAVCPAGSLIAWSGSTWHGAGANQSRHPRLALNFHYCRSWLRPQESQVLGVDPADVLRMPADHQRLLGFDGSLGLRSPVEVLADREAGRAQPWVHPNAGLPGVSKRGDPLPRDHHGQRRVVGGPHDGATRVGEFSP